MMKNFDPSPPSRFALRVYLRFLPRFAFGVGPITDADGLFPPSVSSLPLPFLSLSPFNWRRQKVEYDCGAAAAADRPRGGRGGVIPTTAAA